MLGNGTKKMREGYVLAYPSLIFFLLGNSGFSLAKLELGIVVWVYFTEALKSLPGLKNAMLCSGIITVFFFKMSLAVFSFLVFVWNVPNPLR